LGVDLKKYNKKEKNSKTKLMGSIYKFLLKFPRNTLFLLLRKILK
jgi:hypothetical protein